MIPSVPAAFEGGFGRTSAEEVAAALRQYPGRPISLLVGEPWYGPPRELIEAMMEAAGLHSFRVLLSELERERGLDVGPENIVIGNGSKSLLFGLIMLLGRPRVLTAAPYYPGVAAQTRLLGYPLEVIRAEAPGYKLDPGKIAHDDEKGGCLVLSSPSNPTGVVYDSGEQAELVAACRTAGLSLIADEAYIDLVHDRASTSFGRADPSLATGIVLRSFSKSLGVCGWRMGYAIARPDIAEQFAGWQSRTLNPPSTLAQTGLEKYLRAHEVDRLVHSAHFRTVLENLRQGLQSLGIPSVQPQGGFYLFCDLSEQISRGSFKGSADICNALAGVAGVGVWPGDDFGKPGWVRLSCSKIGPEDHAGMISAVLNRMREFFAGRETES
jgi:aspartate aminotransferase